MHYHLLSGYLMTLVLNEKYGFDPAGLQAYATNRGLRIFPAYHAACAFMAAVYLLILAPAARVYPWLHRPDHPAA